jgi:hypothetical protein
MKACFFVRRIALAAGALVFAGLTVAAEDIRVGASRDEVLHALGEPRGRMEYEAVELMFYDRGRVELENGEVVMVRLMSQEAWLQKQEEEAEARAVAAAARARRLANLYAEGTSLRDARLADDRFMQSSAAERVAYWEKFRQRYPNVPVGDAYILALEERQTEYLARTRELEQAQRMRELEMRVQEAEERARDAERVARSARSRSYVDFGYTTYYPVPAYVSSRPIRPVHKVCSPIPAYRPVSACRPVYKPATPCATPYYAGRSTGSRGGIRVSGSYRGSTSFARIGVGF